MALRPRSMRKTVRSRSRPRPDSAKVLPTSGESGKITTSLKNGRRSNSSVSSSGSLRSGIIRRPITNI